MSRKKNITPEAAPATVVALHRRAYPAADTFRDLGDDYRTGLANWREVTPQFARYVCEVLPPIDGPEGSGSYALGECFSATRLGAVHCVIAREGDRWFARYANLMEWPAELLALRDALATEVANG